MTVKDLMTLLQREPPDSPVVIDNQLGLGYLFRNVTLVERVQVGKVDGINGFAIFASELLQSQNKVAAVVLRDRKVPNAAR